MARYRRFDTARASAPGGGVVAEVPDPGPELNDVRLRRAGLKAALSGLELAIARPGRGSEWTAAVRDALEILHEVWTRHIVETEAPGSFLDELVGESPRLATPASRLRREHSEILAGIVRAEKKLAIIPIDDESLDAHVEELREELTALLAALARHRQRGADLVYEAYQVDIGGGY
jgi:hypothetical protein